MDEDNLVIKGLRRQRVRRDVQDEPLKRNSKTPEFVSELRQAREAARAKELADAVDSPYYWWWVFVRESEEVAMARKRKPVDPAVAQLAKDFGNLERPFEEWWFRTGRYLFAETRPIPKVRELLRGEMSRGGDGERLCVEVPLTIRRATVLRQLNKILKALYKPDGSPARLNVFAHSSATYQANKSSKMRLTTFAQFHRVWLRRAEHPYESWAAAGRACGVSATQAKLEPTASWSQQDIDRAMTLDTQRIYRKTRRLIYWAARGSFPCVDKCPREGQLKDPSAGAA